MLVGWQTDKASKEEDMAFAGFSWAQVGFIYLVVFTIELLLRAILMNQLDNYQDDTLIWGLFPKLDWVDIGRWGPESWNYFLKTGLKDPWIAFDTFIVSSGWIETLLFFFMGIKLGGDIL